MSLVNYIEPVNAGSIFVGVGAMVISLVLAYFIFRLFKPICNWMENYYNKDLRYNVIEEKMLDEIAKEKGIDIEAELIKRQVLVKPRKSFRGKIEEQVFEKMFPEEKDE